MAQSHSHGRFAWQAWHNLTSTVALHGRRGTHGTGWRAWARLVAHDAAALCVAGVALGDIHLGFTWQAWHNLTSTVVLRGRHGTHSTGWRAWARLVARDAAALCVAGVALGDIHLGFTWQGWRNLTSTFVLRGRRGTHGTGWRAWARLVARDTAALCVAGVALGDIHLGFTWQAWRNLTSMVVLRGRRGTISHPPSFCVAGVALMALGGALGPALVARDAAALCVAGVALGDIYDHLLSFHMASVAQSHICDIHLGFTDHLTHIFVTRLPVTHHLSHRLCSHTICHTIFVNNSLTHIFVTHHLSQTIFHTHFEICQYQLSHTQLCRTLSFTYSRTSLSHTICHRPFFTHTLSHTNFHTQLCRTPSFTYYLSRYNMLVCSSLVRMSVLSTSRFGSSKSDWSRKPFGHPIHVLFAGMFT